VALQGHYTELKKTPVQELLASRYNKFRTMARFYRVEP
jgi:acetyl-CoA carboxylase alpha subunit